MTKTGSKCGSLVFAPASTTPGVKDSAETKEASFQGGWDQPQLELEKWPFRMKTQIINPGLGKGLNTFIIIINITVITTICHHLAYYIYFFTTWFYFTSFHFILLFRATLRHVEVSRLGIESKLQLPAYPTPHTLYKQTRRSTDAQLSYIKWCVVFAYNLCISSHML